MAPEIMEKAKRVPKSSVLPTSRRVLLPDGDYAIVTDETLKEAKRIVRAELPKYLGGEFVIDDIEAEVLDGPFGWDYIHLNVILQDGHPYLDARRTGDFRYYTYSVFENAGVIPIPVVSFSNRSEIPR